MAEFLTTTGISHKIENIILNAKKNLILVSPYLKISKTFIERIVDTSDRGVSVKIIYGKDELRQTERNALSKIKNLKLFYFQNLHAKCYFNDTEMVITSMNMYEFSEKNNREMGIFLKKMDDLELFEKALAETASIVKSSEIVELYIPKGKFKPNANYKKTNNSKPKTSHSAHCIRCSKSIKFNPGKPLCWDCFVIWSEFENPEYEENHCHGCGTNVSTSMLKPFCYPCFKELEM